MSRAARLVGAGPLQIEFELIRMTEHVSKTTAAQHMDEFYRPFAEVADVSSRAGGEVVPVGLQELHQQGARLVGLQGAAVGDGQDGDAEGLEVAHVAIIGSDERPE